MSHILVKLSQIKFNNDQYGIVKISINLKLLKHLFHLSKKDFQRFKK
jgi:hypothetical protein